MCCESYYAATKAGAAALKRHKRGKHEGIRIVNVILLQERQELENGTKEVNMKASAPYS